MAGRLPAVSYVIDEVTPADLEEITLIETASFSEPWSISGFAGALSFHGAFIRCAREGRGGVILGYVVAWFVADEGQIANLAVRREAQRRGVGAALLDAMLSEARERGMANVYLEVRASNSAARALYAGRGFEEIGKRHGYYRAPVEDGMILRRVMSSVSQ